MGSATIPINFGGFDTVTALQSAAQMENAQADLTYQSNVAAFHAAVSQWITNVQRNRSLGQPDPAPPVIPTKTIYSVVDSQNRTPSDPAFDKTTVTTKTTTYQDPSLAIPVVPDAPSTATGSNGQLSTGAPAQDAQTTMMLMALLQAVAKIEAKLGIS